MAENEKLTCPICGEPTRVWYGNARKDGLCGKHADMLKVGEIFLDPHGRWRETATKNVLTQATTQTPAPAQEQKKEPFAATLEEVSAIVEEQEEKKCLLCNSESGKYLFCKACFAKHHGKTLLFKITCDKDQKLELLNESYEGIYVCKDGHIVKSKSERDIDNYLFEHKIAHAYEKALPINGEVFKPDFYLKDLDVYIEHWGYDDSNKEYQRRKEYKIPKYREKGITLICTYEDPDMQDVETSLQIKLESYKKGEINFLK